MFIGKGKREGGVGNSIGSGTNSRGGLKDRQWPKAKLIWILGVILPVILLCDVSLLFLG